MMLARNTVSINNNKTTDFTNPRNNVVVTDAPGVVCAENFVRLIW
jgi:hypothetical protein